MTDRSRTTQIIGHLVTHNEAERYLASTASWLNHLCDLVVAFDDRSTDATREILKATGARVVERSDAEPSFLDDESAFRQVGWATMEAIAKPEPNDWVLCLDADEYLLSLQPGEVRDQLLDEIELASNANQRAIAFRVDEVFATDETGAPLIRTDGYWGQIRGCRLVRWRPNGRFESRREGGGSVPTSWISWNWQAEQLRLLHYGYARSVDREERYARYAATRGHSARHIASIRQPGVLQPWQGTALPET